MKPTWFILGGGPSLKDFDAFALWDRSVLAINEAGLTLVPWADVLFWCDVRWVRWNIDRIGLHTGKRRITTQDYRLAEIPRAELVPCVPRRDDGSWLPFHDAPGAVAGVDAGTRAINLAYHLGARRVVLLGFDMRDLPQDRWREGNWHDAHEEPPIPGQRDRDFVPAHNRMADEIRRSRLDFEVLNATPNSALECWTKVTLEEVL